MSSRLPPVLVVDDEKNMRLSLKTVLTDERYGVRTVESAEEALELLEREEFFMVITDVRLGGMSGYELLGKVRAQWPDLPVLMITAYATPKLAVEAIKAGAMDYLAKPFAPEELLHAAARCAERYRLLRENASLRARAAESWRLDQIVGACQKMRDLRQLIQTVAPTDARVLVLGESGTGKELVARAIHGHSARKAKPFVAINCGGIPETLLESELFGYMKGSFTGAFADRAGLFEAARGGTIFLDEIAELPFALQVKLLRVVQEREFERIGGTKTIKVNVRILAATNRELEKAVAAGTFREDLYYRLNVIPLHIPPLRERDDDIMLLFEHFMGVFCRKRKRPPLKVSPEARKILVGYRWPGNVRELMNAVEHAVNMADSEFVLPQYLPKALQDVIRRPVSGTLEEIVKEAERRAILGKLGSCGRSVEAKRRIARELGLSLSTLYAKMKALGIDPAGRE